MEFELRPRPAEVEAPTRQPRPRPGGLPPSPQQVIARQAARVTALEERLAAVEAELAALRERCDER